MELQREDEENDEIIEERDEEVEEDEALVDEMVEEAVEEEDVELDIPTCPICDVEFLGDENYSEHIREHYSEEMVSVFYWLYFQSKIQSLK